MPEAWEGRKYSLSESDNFDAYMKELGVGFAARKIGMALTPFIELRKDGDGYCMITGAGLTAVTTKFKSGEPFTETENGKQIQTVIEIQGNKMIQRKDSDPPQLIVNDFGEKEMVATLKANNITCTRKFVASQ